jgi:hypothetical protein
MELEIRKGVVTGWKIKPRDDKWGVVLLEGQPHPFAGPIGNSVEPGDQLAFVCGYAEHPRFGPQYKVQRVLMHLPGDHNMVGWLLQRLPNIGPSRAREIQETFGNTIWDVLENDPAALTAIDGITEERALQIASAFRQERISISVYTQLLKMGVDPKVILYLLRSKLPPSQIARYLEEDPYQLLRFGGISFAAVDEIGLRAGLERNDPRRICGCAVDMLRKERSNGHTAVGYNVVRMKCREQLKLANDVIDVALLEQAPLLRYPAHFKFFGPMMQWANLTYAEINFGVVLRIPEAQLHLSAATAAEVPHE